MNDAPLPMLNGFPVRLVVPGWYSTYWVKSLSSIVVFDQPLKSFFMDTAYRIPDNSGAEETPQQLSKVTVPLTRMSVHSIFVKPSPNEQLPAGQSYTLQGVANDGGSGTAKLKFRRMMEKPGAMRRSVPILASTRGGCGSCRGRRRQKAATGCK